MALAPTLVAGLPAGAQTESVLYSLSTGDGAQTPVGSLTMDSAGNLYGVAGSDVGEALFELIRLLGSGSV